MEPVGRPAGFLAGRAWRRYRNEGGTRDRILSDFLIGAHARLQAGRLLSRDCGFYRGYFEGLSHQDLCGEGTLLSWPLFAPWGMLAS